MLLRAPTGAQGRAHWGITASKLDRRLEAKQPRRWGTQVMWRAQQCHWDSGNTGLPLPAPSPVAPGTAQHLQAPTLRAGTRCPASTDSTQPVSFGAAPSHKLRMWLESMAEKHATINRREGDTIALLLVLKAHCSHAPVGDANAHSSSPASHPSAGSWEPGSIPDGSGKGECPGSQEGKGQLARELSHRDPGTRPSASPSQDPIKSLSPSLHACPHPSGSIPARHYIPHSPGHCPACTPLGKESLAHLRGMVPLGLAGQQDQISSAAPPRDTNQDYSTCRCSFAPWCYTEQISLS